MPSIDSNFDMAHSGQNYGGGMRSVAKFLGFLGLSICASASCFGATISGTVKGLDGAPVEGAFVQARNTKTKMTIIALSDHAGHYRVEKLPAGDYQVQA